MVKMCTLKAPCTVAALFHVCQILLFHYMYDTKVNMANAMSVIFLNQTKEKQKCKATRHG